MSSRDFLVSPVVSRAATMSREVAFSNGTQGYGWMANWCDRCLRDAIFRNTGKGPGCPIIAKVLCDNTVPPEWLVQDEIFADYHCIEFRAPGSGNPEPHPKPEPRGQGTLFPRPEPSVRMLVQPDADVLLAGSHATAGAT